MGNFSILYNLDMCPIKRCVHWSEASGKAGSAVCIIISVLQMAVYGRLVVLYYLQQSIYLLYAFIICLCLPVANYVQLYISVVLHLIIWENIKHYTCSGFHHFIFNNGFDILLSVYIHFFFNICIVSSLHYHRQLLGLPQINSLKFQITLFNFLGIWGLEWKSVWRTVWGYR